MTLRAYAVLVSILVLAACGQGSSPSGKDVAVATDTPLLLSAEDIHTVQARPLADGPTVTGSIQPERRADLRAEVSAMVMQVLHENGEAVRRGDLLVRLDDTALRDALASAESASRAAGQSLDQASRQLERLKTLRSSGMASAQSLDDAEQRRNNAQSDFEAAKARVVAARQQLTRTEVRAPFDGLVSDRKASAGDTAQIGKELLKVIDPASMRFEGLVSADQVGTVKTGQAVSYRANGYGNQEFAGTVRRVSPTANSTTRQVEVIVDLAGQKPGLGGLYAEGRIETERHTGLTLPATAINREGDKTSAWVVRDGKLRKAAVTLGDRDPRSGEFIVEAGLAAGDQVLRYSGPILRDGQSVNTAAPPTKSQPAGGAG